MIHAQNNKLINFYIDNIKLEKGDIATDWTPAPEDVEQNVNELNTWKQTTNQTLNTVTSTLNDTVRHAQLRIGADGIDFGSNKVFNGRNLASILSVSPESIQAITDRLVISPANENLVKREYRDTFILNVRNGVLNRIYGSNIDLVGEYQFKVAIIDFDTPTLNASIHVKYKDGTDSWFNSEFPTPSIATLETSTSVKVQVESRKEIEYIEPLVFQNKWSDFYRFHLKKLFVGKKKSAELIVDGSIEGRQIKAETLETGHHKAGSITSEIIAANAVKAKHILIDDGLINNLVTHNAFISKLWAQDAFIRSLKTVKISTTQLDTDWLSAYTGDIGGFRIGKNPNQPGDFWLTGSNNFNCGLNPGHNIGTRGAQIWAAWGNDWNRAGSNAWWVDGQGRMNCKNSATFYGGLHVYNARLDTHGQDIQGDANSYGAKTTVIWWSQINRVKSSVSDKRFKTNIKPTKVKAVDLLNKIEMVEFNWKKDNKFEKIGAIAQQVQSVEETLVVKDMDSKQSHSDYLRISYYDAIPYLIKAVQELSEENNKLKNKLEEIING
jgi:pblB